MGKPCHAAFDFTSSGAGSLKIEDVVVPDPVFQEARLRKSKRNSDPVRQVGN
jgi:hypothetical protein